VYEKTADKTEVNYGDVVEFTITMRNDHPDTPVRRTLRDIIPEGMELIDWTDDDRFHYQIYPNKNNADDLRIYARNPLFPGDTSEVKIRARMNQIGTLRNCATGAGTESCVDIKVNATNVFTCNDDISYIVAGGNTLHTMTPAGVTAKFADLTITDYNAIAVRPQSGLMYGASAEKDRLYVVNTLGSVLLHAPLPSTVTTAHTGTYDPRNDEYILVSGKTMYFFSPTLDFKRTLALTGNTAIADIAYNPNNGLLYSFASNGHIVEINPVTGVVRELLNDHSTVAGAMGGITALTSNGQFRGFGYGPAGGPQTTWFAIDVIADTVSVVTTDQLSSSSIDAASCVPAFTPALPLTKTLLDADGEIRPGDTTQFEITITNDNIAPLDIFLNELYDVAFTYVSSDVTHGQYVRGDDQRPDVWEIFGLPTGETATMTITLQSATNLPNSTVLENCVEVEQSNAGPSGKQACASVNVVSEVVRGGGGGGNGGGGGAGSRPRTETTPVVETPDALPETGGEFETTPLTRNGDDLVFAPNVLPLTGSMPAWLAAKYNANSRFADTSVNHDFYQAAIDLNNQGIAKGYNNGGNMGLDDLLQRDQAAKLVAHGMQVDLITNATNSAYSDLTTANWSMGYVVTLTESDTVQGYLDGSFRPGGRVTGPEFASMLRTLVGINADLSDRADWKQAYFGELAVRNLLYPGATQGNFNNALTRGQAFEMLSRALRMVDAGNSSYVSEVTVNIPTAGVADLSSPHTLLSDVSVWLGDMTEVGGAYYYDFVNDTHISFAHSSVLAGDPNPRGAVYARLGDDLNIGDEYTMTIDGTVHTYIVRNKELIADTDVEALRSASFQSIVFTCDDTLTKRWVVYGERV
jgi:uncharacterized repeat protein (TIGR01451 family)